MSASIAWDDIRRETRTLLEMEKDIASGGYRYQWPAPGNNLSLDLQANEDRSLKFYLDIFEGRRMSSVVIGLSPTRKATMQNRLSDSPILRLDYVEDPNTLHHTNPDGEKIVGPHIHFDLDGRGMRWAVPLSCQTVIVGAEQMGIPELFWSFLDICHIDKKLEVEQSLGV